MILFDLSSTTKPHETRLAVRPAFELSEGTAKQRLTAERADKVFDVIAARQCRHTAAEDGTAAAGTLRRPSLAYNMSIAVWVAVAAFVATPRLQTNAAVLHQ